MHDAFKSALDKLETAKSAIDDVYAGLVLGRIKVDRPELKEFVGIVSKVSTHFDFKSDWLRELRLTSFEEVEPHTDMVGNTRCDCGVMLYGRPEKCNVCGRKINWGPQPVDARWIYESVNRWKCPFCGRIEGREHYTMAYCPECGRRLKQGKKEENQDG